ncbi:MAG: NUDIX hydrolase [Clostridia bacterium]|nr:NUDIX hydrolase [Clostridia bacterium]
MEEKFNKRIKEEKGKYLHYCVDEVTLSNGHISTREMVVHPGAVGIVALTAEKELVLVKQYRYPVQKILYEIPAGKLEKGEDPDYSARRELEEETGYSAEKWEKLASFYTAPGFSNEYMHLYLATNLVKKKAHPDPDEIITYEKVPLAQVLQRLETGKIRDGKTILGILWLQKKVMEKR